MYLFMLYYQQRLDDSNYSDPFGRKTRRWQDGEQRGLEGSCMRDSNSHVSVTKPFGVWRRRILLAIPSGIAAYLLVLAILNYNGYCFKEGRFLSDKEKIRIVIERSMLMRGAPLPFWPLRDRNGNVLKDKDGKLQWVVSKDGNVSPTDEPVIPILFRDVDEFLMRNPNCCEMRKEVGVGTSEGWFEPDFWDRVLGSCSGGVVRITGTYQFRDMKDGTIHKIQDTSDSFLSNCGRGLTIPTLK